jgi:hypothetical protein
MRWLLECRLDKSAGCASAAISSNSKIILPYARFVTGDSKGKEMRNHFPFWNILQNFK